jgi:predicted ATP-dependent endonuclease of OLD family
MLCAWLTSGVDSLVKLIKVLVKNFRSLKEIEVDLQSELSIVVGKNNSGKTSFLLALDKFLGNSKTRFDLDDFNVDFQTHLENLLTGAVQPADPYPFTGISVRLFIEYGDLDDLSNVGNKVIMDLDPDNRSIILDFLYHLPQGNLDAFKRDFDAHRAKKGEKASDPSNYLRENHSAYFKLAKRSIHFDHLAKAVSEDNWVDLIAENIKTDDIISFKRISARRSVSNNDTDRGLSTMSANIYKAMSAEAGDEEIIDKFKEALTDTDGQLDEIYRRLFEDVISDVRRFGGVKDGDTKIEIRSTLQHRDLLEDNTTVMYGQGVEMRVLPETYNGLGYLNLISIIFEIKILLNEFKRNRAAKPADINLLFIEEPEAHTHPQMQAIFIKNIKTLIGKAVRNSDGVERPLQTILSTHSAHIVAESDFDDIKYFKRSNGKTESKSLKALEELYLKAAGDNGSYKFLKQYLTLHRSQMFFADKAILVEGDTERILLPAMMRKIDQTDAALAWEADQELQLPLLSQNISVVEVGAHSKIFEIFLEFIGVKTLIVTDIDSAGLQPRIKKDGSPALNKKTGAPITDIVGCAIDKATHTTNYSLRHFFSVGHEIAFFIELPLAKKTVRKNPATEQWESHADGQLMCAFQIPEADNAGEVYHARSFEDAFFHANSHFIKDAHYTGQIDGYESFPSLKASYLEEFLEGDCTSWDMANDGITKKPSFAIEILLNSQTKTVSKTNPKFGTRDFAIEFSNWKTPQYIEEGLRWIKKD